MEALQTMPRQTYDYRPFGQLTNTPTDSNPFQFTGRESEGGTGLMYYRARYYAPERGRGVTGEWGSELSASEEVVGVRLPARAPTRPLRAEGKLAMAGKKDDRAIFAPFLPTLTAFAAEHGLDVHYDSGDHPWGDVNYRLQWRSAKHHVCRLFLNWLSGDKFVVRSLCWSQETSSRPPEQRWGPEDLIGQRTWEISAGEEAAASLKAILVEAKRWTDGL